MKTQYDDTCYEVITPEGIGKYVFYNPVTKMVAVEMDHRYLVEFAAAECTIIEKKKERP